MAHLPLKENASTLAVAVDSLVINSRVEARSGNARSQMSTRFIDFNPEVDDDVSSCGSWECVSETGDELDASKADTPTPTPTPKDNIDYESFLRAADKGDVDALKAFLDAGADIEKESVRDWTPLVLAILGHHVEAVKFLLSRGASVSHRARTLPPLVHALTKEGTELMQLLVDHGADLKSLSGKDHKNALHWAASEGMTDALELLLKKGMDIEAKSKRGCTPLLLSADCGHPEVAEILLNHGANLNARSENGGTPLIWAACHNHVEIAKVFLDHGADINEADNFGHSAIFLAAHFGHLEMTNFLLEKGANAHILSTKPEGMTVLHAAACDGHAKVVQRLIDHGCDPEIKTAMGDTTLDTALAERKEEVVQVLLEAMGGPDHPKNSIALQFAMADSHPMVKTIISITELCYPRIKDPTPANKYEWISWVIEEGGSLLRMPALRKMLHYALEEHNLEMLKSLIDQGCDVNMQLESTSTPLCYAVKHSNIPMIELLLDSGVDIDAFHGEGYTALDEAIFNMKDAKDTEAVDILLKHGAKINRGKDPGHTALSLILLRDADWNELALRMVESVQDINEDRDSMGSTLLHVATLRNRKDVVDLLLSKGADLESKDQFNVTPFLLACQHSHEMIPFLLGRGADINAVYRADAHALHAAAAQGNVEALKALLDRGLNIEELTEKAYTPLACALTWGQEAAALLLMERGANVNLQTTKGVTPLHFACKNNLIVATHELLRRGAKVDVREKEGWTPLHDACATGSPAIVTALLERGADYETELPNKDRPLHVALINERELIARALIEHAGASITAKASGERSSLHLASEYNLSESANLLIDKGASTEEVDEDSWTPLCCFGGPDVVKTLIARGANVNYKDRDCWTPLHQAVENDHFEEAKMLLHAGADMSVRTTDDGMTVRERAEDKEDKEVAKNFVKLLDEFEEFRRKKAEHEKSLPK